MDISHIKNPVIYEWIKRTAADHSEFWLDWRIDGEFVESFGPFKSAAVRQRFLNEIMNEARKLGGIDMPSMKQ